MLRIYSFSPYPVSGYCYPHFTDNWAPVVREFAWCHTTRSDVALIIRTSCCYSMPSIWPSQIKWWESLSALGPSYHLGAYSVLCSFLKWWRNKTHCLTLSTVRVATPLVCFSALYHNINPLNSLTPAGPVVLLSPCPSSPHALTFLNNLHSKVSHCQHCLM